MSGTKKTSARGSTPGKWNHSVGQDTCHIVEVTSCLDRPISSTYNIFNIPNIEYPKLLVFF